MHFGDSILIFILALVLFGPKRLPEIGRTVGKLLAEFRRASNEFKFQIQDEIRQMEDEERRKKLADSQAAAAAAPTVTTPSVTTESSTPSIVTPSDLTPSILPPSTGETVSTARPFTPAADATEPLPVSPELALNSAEIVGEPAAHVARDGEATNGVHPPTTEAAPEEAVNHD
ncbi:MAG: twin-arginine translocase TatA/TatE family subunit [Acidobacteriaceae bacterium]